MKKEEKLVNNKDEQIELNFAPNQHNFNINEEIEFDIKKNYKK